MENIKTYRVTKFAERCEEHNKLNEVIPLIRGKCKLVLFIVVNIITVGIINLIIAWFPKLKLYLYYERTSLENATHFGIISNENSFEIIKKNIIEIPEKVNKENSVIKRFKINIDSGKIITFEYRLFTYIYSEENESFEFLDYQIKDTEKAIKNSYTEGLDNEETNLMRSLFGICNIDIKISSIGVIILNELTDPYYIFQVYSCILYLCVDYASFALITIALAIALLIFDVYCTYTNLKEVQKISKYSCNVNVYRKDDKGEIIPIKIDSSELVPGDLYEIPEEGNNIPADTILVSGSVILNESILTGESTPIVKHEVTNTDNIYNTKSKNYDKKILFTGTKIIQKRNFSNKKVLGIVFQTGFNSIKGNLISNILNAKNQERDIIKESIKFIIFMGILCIIEYGISLYFLIKANVLSTGDLVEKFFELITSCVPPSVQINIGIYYSLRRLKKKNIICISRDRINLTGSVNLIVFDKTGTLTDDHLDIKGFVPITYDYNNNFIFDDYFESCENYSEMVVNNYKEKLKNKIKNISNDLMQYYIECLACCHCLTYSKGNIIGDPIDIKMFEKVGWILQDNLIEENNIYNPLINTYVRPSSEINLINLTNDEKIEKLKERYEIGIVRQFDFNSQLQRMTIITKNIKEDYFKVFCKGSPEKIKMLCLPETIPTNYNEELEKYTSQGYRVLGMGAKGIKIDFKLVQNIDRSLIEKNLIFLGFLIVKNKLKEKTIESIEKYDKADIKMVMATGDNILTAINVSRECKLVHNDQEVYSISLEKNLEKEILKLEKLEIKQEYKNIETKYENIENNYEELTISSRQNLKYKLQSNLKINTSDKCLIDIFPLELISENSNSKVPAEKIIDDNEKKLIILNEDKKEENKISEISEESKELSPIEILDDKLTLQKENNFVIAITGNIFEKLYNLNKNYIKYGNKNLEKIHKLFRLILKNGVVFSRMSPEHKGLLIQSFKDEGFITMMCGDGANDSIALRTSHVGVSLTKEEVSIAGHFISGTNDISSLFEILREGKCCLITTTQIFKYDFLFLLDQSINETLLLISKSYLSDFQLSSSDFIVMLAVGLLFPLTHPCDELSYHYPVFQLLSFPNILCILIHAVIILAFQLGGLKILQKFYDFKNVCGFDSNDAPIKCHENTILFLIALFQYNISSIALSVSKPFKKSVFTNIPFIIYIVLILFYSIWITLNCDNWSSDLMNIQDLSKYTLIKTKDDGKEISRETIYIKHGDKMKYYLFLIIIINSLLTIVIEWFIIPLFTNCYESKEIENIKKKIENERKQNNNDEKEIVIKVTSEELNELKKENKILKKEVSLSDHQKLFFNERRIKM